MVSHASTDDTLSRTPVATVRRVSKTFGSTRAAVRAVNDADLVLYRGEIVAVVGTSGSGKSTLLTLLIGWEQPDTGRIVVHDPTAGFAEPGGLGWDVVAVMPQALGLLEDLSMWDNILLPARSRRRLSECSARASELVEELRIDHLVDRYPSEMSLGEQQRAAFARTLVLSPQLVFADEPTAHQDHGFVEVMLETMRREARRGTSIVLATHNAELTGTADRVLRMRDGVLSDEAVA